MPPAIRVSGARVHNLQDVTLEIPRNQLTVVTGVSGSGKSSLAIDTIFVEGQRRYLTALSPAVARWPEFRRPIDVDEIAALPPTLAVRARSRRPSPRGTLATITEIYSRLQILYAQCGTPHCPKCGAIVVPRSVDAVTDSIAGDALGRKVVLLAPLVRGKKGSHSEVLERIGREGFVRARIDGSIVDLADVPKLAKGKPHNIDVVIDRIVVRAGLRPRLLESVTLALKHGLGQIVVMRQDGETWTDELYSSRFSCAACNLSFESIEPRTFSFQSPYGACARCGGLGQVTAQIGPAAGKGRRGDTNHETATAEVLTCPDCQGARLGPVGRALEFHGDTLPKFVGLAVDDARSRVAEWQSRSNSTASPSVADIVAARLLPQIADRLRFLSELGLDYLALDRPADTLSGGEFQRARLAGCLGGGLRGVCYVLDEPTMGLHPRDNATLLAALRTLRDQGNTLVVVEHDTDVMRAADWLLELGPGAGIYGGRLICCGPPARLATCPESVTARFLYGDLHSTRTGRIPEEPHGAQIAIAALPESWPRLSVANASAHNLQGISVEIPLGCLTCVTGVSGSGKTSLLLDTLVPIARQVFVDREYRREANPTPNPDSVRVTGLEQIQRLVEIDQDPRGRSARSNPATLSGLWEHIRRVFAATRESKLRGYKSQRFSLSLPGGRCDVCKGTGQRRSSQWTDVPVLCPVCHGARFNRPTLQVRFRGLNAADVLQLRIEEALPVFESFATLESLLRLFCELGLGYLTLGQSALTLSTGELQRLRLATDLSHPGFEPTLYVLDEPTTGLHPQDVEHLLKVLDSLISRGHSVIVIEHHLDVVRAADWVIDLGPGSGANGGWIVAAGTPELVSHCAASQTGMALRNRWSGRPK